MLKRKKDELLRAPSVGRRTSMKEERADEVLIKRQGTNCTGEGGEEPASGFESPGFESRLFRREKRGPKKINEVKKRDCTTIALEA